MRKFIEGIDRQQTMFLPECLDDYVDEDGAVRAIDAFVDMLSLPPLPSGANFAQPKESHTGLDVAGLD